MCNNLHVRPADLTAAALIRESAMRLAAERGWGAVTIRDIAAGAGVSPSLVVHHYGTKGRLRDAADQRVSEVFTELIDTFFVLEDPGEVAVVSLASAFHARVGDSAVLGYARRLLVDGGDAAARLFDALYSATLRMLDVLESRGLARPTDDHQGRAAFLLVSDLAVMLMRDEITRVLGIDPLSRAGLERWGRTAMDTYGRGMFGAPDAADGREVRDGGTNDRSQLGDQDLRSAPWGT